jgi:hypothetical protein
LRLSLQFVDLLLHPLHFCDEPLFALREGAVDGAGEWHCRM